MSNYNKIIKTIKIKEILTKYLKNKTNWGFIPIKFNKNRNENKI